MQNVGTQPRRGPKRGYGGKWKKWLAIYLVVGAVVYAVVYFAFLHHSGGSGGGYALVPLPAVSALRRRALIEEPSEDR
jgi:hypothetical protein